jgi:hypothetical protein
MVLTTLNGISQTSDSVTCLPNSQLRKAISLIEKGKVTEKELELTKEKMGLLESRLLNKDSLINRYTHIENDYKVIVKNQDKIIEDNKLQSSNYEKIISLKTKQVRNQVKKKWIGIAVGVVVGFLAFH